MVLVLYTIQIFIGRSFGESNTVDIWLHTTEIISRGGKPCGDNMRDQLVLYIDLYNKRHHIFRLIEIPFKRKKVD